MGKKKKANKKKRVIPHVPKEDRAQLQEGVPGPGEVWGSPTALANSQYREQSEQICLECSALKESLDVYMGKAEVNQAEINRLKATNDQLTIALNTPARLTIKEIRESVEGMIKTTKGLSIRNLYKAVLFSLKQIEKKS